MTARIRPAGLEAAEVFALLHAAGFAKPWDAAEFRRLLATPGAFALIVSSEAPCGMLLGWVAADEAEILTLSVDPAARRRGFGRDLVNAAIAEAGRRGARAVFLEVASTNAPAMKLYESLGFRAAGRRRGYYRSAEGSIDAIVMRLDLVRDE